MEVACYAQHQQQQHSEFQQRGGIPAYELQSSPGSVDSITSTDAGPVQAIQNFHLQQQQQFSEHEFHKLSGAGKNLQFCGDYHQQQQKECGGRQASYMQQSVNRNRDYLTPAAVSDSYSALHGDSQSESATQHRLNVTIPTEQTTAATTLTTPDVVNMLRGGDFATTSSSVTSHSSEPSFYVGEKHVTQEQEMYAQGFVRELERLKSGAVGDDKPGLITSIAHHHYEPSSYFDHQPSSSGTVHHMAAMHHPLGHLSPHSAMLARLKEEPPQTVPMLAKSPPVSPIDMDHQEVIKSERKRLRNRIAASKCRKRKLERISRLEDKVAALKSQNHELSSSANLLRQQVAELKSKVMAHVNSGCQLMLTQHQVTF